MSVLISLAGNILTICMILSFKIVLQNSHFNFIIADSGRFSISFLRTVFSGGSLIS